MAQISIIIPILNGEKFIKGFSESLKNLKFDYKLIIIDGGSTDDTLDVLKKELKEVKYVIYPQKNNDRIYGAMNQALKIVDTEYVTFYGIDDRFLTSFNNMYSLIKIKEGNMIYGGYYNLKKQKAYLHKFYNYHFIFRNICHQAIIYRSNELKKFMYDAKYKVQADHYLNIQFFSNVRKIIYFNEVVCSYDGGGFSSNTYDEKFQKDFSKIIRMNFGFLLGIVSILKKLIVKIIK